MNLTWEKLDDKTQKVGELLSLFNPNEITWEYVESVSELLNWKNKDVIKAKKQLHELNFIKSLEREEESYQFYPLIREFLRTKLQLSPQKNDLKQVFINSFIEISKTIPETTTLEFINSVKNAIPHLQEVLENLIDAISDENLYYAFTGLARFYYGQGLYTLAEPWLQQCVSTVRSRLGVNHLDTATSINNLAYLYFNQGKYEQAESLLIQALELIKQLLGENHPSTASSLNNLAQLYSRQGKYDEAKPLFIQTLDLRKKLLGENHPETASSLNNLAYLYNNQGKYDEAEPLMIQALQLQKQLLGEKHPSTATR